MPIYDFQCHHCDKVFEDLCSLDTETTTCPICLHPADKILSTLADYTGSTSKLINRKLGKHGAKYKE